MLQLLANLYLFISIFVLATVSIKVHPFYANQYLSGIAEELRNLMICVKVKYWQNWKHKQTCFECLNSKCMDRLRMPQDYFSSDGVYIGLYKIWNKTKNLIKYFFHKIIQLRKLCFVSVCFYVTQL